MRLWACNRGSGPAGVTPPARVVDLANEVVDALQVVLGRRREPRPQLLQLGVAVVCSTVEDWPCWRLPPTAHGEASRECPRLDQPPA
eukprot:8333229-Pyramimonas_sp.AAC.1